MGASDWSLLSGSLPDGSLKAGVSAGGDRPNGGGQFCYAFNSIDASVGGAALYVSVAGFGALAKGASIRGALKRGLGGGNAGFSPFLFASLQDESMTDVCYMLGLSDDDPHRIVLAKGTPSQGVGAHTEARVKAKGTETFSPNTWLHLRMDVIQNDNGEVVINCYRNNLATNTVSAPVWVPVVGMAQLIDDIAQINTGSAPLLGGRAGFGFASSASARRAFVDAIELYKQV